MSIRQRASSRRIVNALAALAAVVVAMRIILSAAIPGWDGGGPLGLDAGPVTALEHVLAIGAGLALLLVANGLWHGTRRAALVAGLSLGTLAAAGLDNGEVIGPSIELLITGLLVSSRSLFPRGASRAGVTRPAVYTGVVAAAAWATAALMLVLAGQAAGFGAAINWLLEGTWWLSSKAAPALVLDLLVVGALAAAGLLVARILRPHVSGEGHSELEHARAAALVVEHGVDSLDPFALRPDKSFHFGAGGFLAYRTVRGTAVISGDPIGPPGAAPAILASFVAEANRRGWSVAMTAAGSRYLEGYRELGFQTLCIGEEAVVDPSGFSLDGARMKTVRKAVGRQQRRGWTIDVISGRELGETTVTQLDAVDREWRARQPRLTGFAMTLGRLWGAEEDARSVYATGRDPEGVIRAFVRFVVYQRGLSLDVMRRVGESPNGLTETLVVAVIEHARAEGLPSVSLNFAGFAHLMGPDRPLTHSQRILRRALARSHDRFQLERLVRFNKKFQPTWQPRYLVYQSSLDLPVAGLRVLQAEAYIRAPRSPLLSARWEPASRPVLPTSPPTALPAR